MRASSSTTRSLLDRLRQSLWRAGPRLTGPEEVQLLDQAGQTGRPDAVPVLFAHLFRDDDVVAATAAGGIEQVVRVCTSLELARLDSAVREVGDWQWPAVNAADLARLSYGLTGVLGVIASHRSGYVREAAIRLLAATTGGDELPFLLIRLNDWVHEVRDAAKSAVVARIRPDYAVHFACHLPLVVRLQVQSRDNHSKVVEPVLRLLQSPEGRPALLAALAASDRHARRLAFGLLLDPPEHLHDTIARGLAADDVVIRLRAGRVARERMEGPALVQVLGRMLDDRFMPVRREALYGYVERLPEVAHAVLRSSLLDPHASMRGAARFYLRQRGESDFASFYRAKLAVAGHDQRAVVVDGLGETGIAEDVHRVESLLQDADPRVRRAAVRALGRLDAEHSVEHLLSALEDHSAGVAKAARDVLRPRLFLVPPQRWWSIFLAAEQPHTRRAVLSLIAGLGWWDSAPMLVAAAGSQDVEVSVAAKRSLNRWRGNAHRLSVRPRREQLLLLDAALWEHRGRLDQIFVDDLEAHLSYAGRELT